MLILSLLACAWPSAPQVIIPDAPYGAYLRREAPRDALDTQALPESPPFLGWHDWVLSNMASHLDDQGAPDYREMIREAQKIPVTRSRANEKMLAGEMGTIRPAECLETLLTAEHEARHSMREKTTEFRAWVLEKQGALRVYFASGRIPGMAPTITAIEPTLREDVASGWTLLIDMHSHPFNFNQPYGVGNTGALPVPSTQDFRAFRSQSGRGLAPVEFRVTNGFHTGVVPIQEALSHRED